MTLVRAGRIEPVVKLQLQRYADFHRFSYHRNPNIVNELRDALADLPIARIADSDHSKHRERLTFGNCQLMILI
jgi:hypothetical protein